MPSQTYPVVKAALLDRLTTTFPDLRWSGTWPMQPAARFGTVLYDGDSRADPDATYRFLVTFARLWDDPAAAEGDLDAYVNAIPLAIDADPGLAETCLYAWDSGGTGSFVDLAGAPYRLMDRHVVARVHSVQGYL
jgi:hypothetical protein